MSCWVFAIFGLFAFQQQADAQICLQASCVDLENVTYTCPDGQSGNSLGALYRICADDVEAGEGDIDAVTGAPIPGTGDFTSENQCTIGADGDAISSLMIRILHPVTGAPLPYSSDRNQSRDVTNGSYRPCLYLTLWHLNNFPDGVDIELQVTGVDGFVTTCTASITYNPPSCNVDPDGEFDCEQIPTSIPCTANPVDFIEGFEPDVTTYYNCLYDYDVRFVDTKRPNFDPATGAHCFIYRRTYTLYARCKWPTGSWETITTCVQEFNIYDIVNPEIYVGGQHDDGLVETFLMRDLHRNDCFVGTPPMMLEFFNESANMDIWGNQLYTYDVCDVDVHLMLHRELDFNESVRVCDPVDGTPCRTVQNTFVDDPRQDNYYCYSRVFAYIPVDNCGNSGEDTLYWWQTVTDSRPPSFNTSDDGTTRINSCDFEETAQICVTVSDLEDNCAARKYLAIFITLYHDDEGNGVIDDNGDGWIDDEIVMTEPSQYAQGDFTLCEDVVGAEFPSVECQYYIFEISANDPCLNMSEMEYVTHEVCNPFEGPIAKCDNVTEGGGADENGDWYAEVDAVDIDEGSEDICVNRDEHPGDYAGNPDAYYATWFPYVTEGVCGDIVTDVFDDFDGCLVDDAEDLDLDGATGTVDGYSQFLAPLGIGRNDEVFINYNYMIVQIRRVDMNCDGDDSDPGPWVNDLPFDEDDCNCNGGVITVELRAINGFGLVSTCRSQVTLQNCPAPGGVIARVTSPEGSPIKGVTVNFDNGTSTVTDAAGDYRVPTGLAVVSMERGGDPMNGVNTFDAYLAQQMLLGNIAATQYQKIAADANINSNFTIGDLATIKAAIVRNITLSQAWRFVDGGFTIDNFSWNVSDASNVVGVKVADLDDSADKTQRLGGELIFAATDRAVKAGETVSITLNGDVNDLVALQGTFELNGLEYVSVEGAALKLDDENLGLHGNKLAFAWFDTQSVTTNDDMFTLEFVATQDGQLSEMITIGSSTTKAAAFDSNGAKMSVALRLDKSDFALYQNRPNPFTESTIVSFNLPETSDVELTVFDVAGKVLKSFNGSFDKGYNEITINSNDLQGSGVMYYRLSTNNQTITKKMISLD